MPRNGSGIYTQPFPDVVDGTTIESAVYNGFTNDVALQLNGPIPVSAGGTGSSDLVTGANNTGTVSVKGAQAYTEAEKTQGRNNIGVPNTNIAINGDFRVNQSGYVSAAALSVGLYGHDQWKAGASGGDYSFTQLKSSTQITIASGKSLIQPIEDANVVGGSYVLSWTGTAQARAGINTLTPSGAYAASPVLIVGQTAGTAMSIEFNAGTLSTVKLEIGTVATPFVMRPYDQELVTCQRYYQRYNYGQNQMIATLQAANTTACNGKVMDFLPMRATPTAYLTPSTSNFALQPAGGGSATITAVTAGTSLSSVYFSTISATGLVAGNAVQFFCSNAAGGQLTLDARL